MWKTINVPALRQEYETIWKCGALGVQKEVIREKHPEFSKRYPLLFTAIIDNDPLARSIFDRAMYDIEEAQKAGKADLSEETHKFGNEVNNKYIPAHLR